MAMSPDAVMRTWFEELWNKGDESTIDRLLHPDAVIHGLAAERGQAIRGPGEFKPFFHAFRTAFPDISVELLHVVTEGDISVGHCRVVGTHRGDSLGVPATGRRIDIQGFALGRFVNGQLIEGWNAFDFLGMYQQLGVQPAR